METCYDPLESEEDFYQKPDHQTVILETCVFVIFRAAELNNSARIAPDSSSDSRPGKGRKSLYVNLAATQKPNQKTIRTG